MYDCLYIKHLEFCLVLVKLVFPKLLENFPNTQILKFLPVQAKFSDVDERTDSHNKPSILFPEICEIA
jgi:hypothetical protein